MKQVKNILILIMIIVMGVTANAHDITSNYNKVANGYNYLFYAPEDVNPFDRAEARPLVIFLHGASLCGNDLNKVKRYGTISAIEKGRDIDAYVVAPQNPGGAWNPEKIMNVVNKVSEENNIDMNRIYVLGMSLGGYGTLDLAAAYPDRIAAAIAMCGGATAKNLPALNDVPLWIIHGTADSAVPISQSDRVVAAMKAADPATPRLTYNRIPGMNHSQPARLFYIDEIYDWLFAHSLSDVNRPKAATFELSSTVFKSAYAGLNHSKQRRSTPSYTVRNKNSAKSAKATAAKTSRKTSKRG